MGDIKALRKIILILLCIFTVSATVYTAQARQYNDIDEIMSGIDITVNQRLRLASPSKNITTTASAYYITGSYNPNYPLICNGYNVSAVGRTGTFATYVNLDYGANVYNFSQADGSSASVTITRNRSAAAQTTKDISAMSPLYNSYYESGMEITLKCTAPYSSTVVASLLGQDYTLSPVATAQPGVPAIYKATVIFPDVSSVKNIGKVKYTLNYNGTVKTYNSAGSITAYPKDSAIYLTPSNPSVPLVTNPTTYNSAVASLRSGGIDYVIDQTDNYYKLSSGYWINKDSVDAVHGKRVVNTVNNIAFTKTMYGEMLTFEGTSTPIAVGTQYSDRIELTMHYTTGISSIPVKNSDAISSYNIENVQNATKIVLKLKPDRPVLGFSVDYNGSNTSLYIQYKPKIDSTAEQPLKGIRVVLDPGHGGSDPGALGVAGGIGDTESVLTKNTSTALRRRLEKLGAQVYVVDTNIKTGKVGYTERTDPAYSNRAHVFLSIHYNSTGGDARKANGIEVHYFYDTHKEFSQNLLDAMVASTGREKRKIYNSVFRVSFNTLCPAPLLELGFVSNPVEYDIMNTREGMFNTVNGIANGIIDYFS